MHAIARFLQVWNNCVNSNQGFSDWNYTDRVNADLGFSDWNYIDSNNYFILDQVQPTKLIIAYY